MAGTSRFITCETPPSIPPTWAIVMATVIAQAHTTQPTRKRGPGMRFTASSPVSAMAMV